MPRWLCGLTVLIVCSLAGCASAPSQPARTTLVTPLVLPAFPQLVVADDGLLIPADQTFEAWQFIVSCQGNTDIASALGEAVLASEQSLQACQAVVEEQHRRDRRAQRWRWLERLLWSGVVLALAL